MKKIIALVLTVVMALSLVACAQDAGNTSDTTDNTANNTTNNSANNTLNDTVNDTVNDDAANDTTGNTSNGTANDAGDDTAGSGTSDEDIPADNNDHVVDGDNEFDVPAVNPDNGEADPDAPVTDDTPAPSGDTIGKTLAAYFESLVNGGETDLETLANTLVTHESIKFMGGAMQVAPGYLAGFSSDITGFADGWFFGPMIGTIPFAGYVFTVDGDANAFVATLKDNADLRWNICTSADEINIKVVGSTVFCLLSPYSIEG